MTTGHGDYSYSGNKNPAFLCGVSELCHDITILDVYDDDDDILSALVGIAKSV
jgi:hypothetical protein